MIDRQPPQPEHIQVLCWDIVPSISRYFNELTMSYLFHPVGWKEKMLEEDFSRYAETLKRMLCHIIDDTAEAQEEMVLNRNKRSELLGKELDAT